MAPETRYARTTDGTHVAYQVTGDGPVDILVLRAWHSHLDHEWAEPVLAGIYRRLGSVGRLLLLDRRGTGLSDPIDPARPPTLEDRIDDILAVMRAAGSSRIVPIGLAHGGGLAAVFAATHPERTQGLIMWAPPRPLVGRPAPDELDAILRSLPTTWGTTESAEDGLDEIAPSRCHDAQFIEWLRQDELLSATPEAAAAQVRLLAETNVDNILPTIHVPTLVVWRAEAAGAATSRYVARRIPSAAAVELPGADHMLISGDWRRPLAEMERFIESTLEADPDRDRMLATVLFTDIVQSTEKAAALGDRAWRRLIDEHHILVRRELARFRGRELDTAGDGFLANFDGPGRAIRCAAAIRDGIGGLGLVLRFGVHTGECERTAGGLRGLAVHVGARVAGLAQPGEILTTSTVRDLVAGSGITFEDAGSRQLKGVPGQWPLYRVAR